MNAGQEGKPVGLTTAQLREHLDAIAGDDPVVASALARVGYPQERLRAPGYRTLLRTIVGQQVSVAAAASVWRKLEDELGPDMRASDLLSRDFETLRACGLSRQKQGYARSLCALVEDGTLQLDRLPADDKEAIDALTQIKGIGRWSAEIYLLFAEGRPDIWPAGDLAVQAALHTMLHLDARPSEKETRRIGERWKPYRGAMAIFTWHAYANPAP